MLYYVSRYTPFPSYWHFADLSVALRIYKAENSMDHGADYAASARFLEFRALRCHLYLVQCPVLEFLIAIPSKGLQI